MDPALSETPRHALSVYIERPTDETRAALVAAADQYRESWLASKASANSDDLIAHQRSPRTRYKRKLEVSRLVEDIPVTLALQQRIQATVAPWWILSWRTKYFPAGLNRRFYQTNDGIWTIPAHLALDMIEEMDALGGLDDAYLDQRGPDEIEFESSVSMTAPAQASTLAAVTGPDENWGHHPLFVICSDPNQHWKKVLIVDPSTDVATFGQSRLTLTTCRRSC
jgi:hypothetical protein